MYFSKSQKLRSVFWFFRLQRRRVDEAGQFMIPFTESKSFTTSTNALKSVCLFYPIRKQLRLQSKWIVCKRHIGMSNRPWGVRIWGPPASQPCWSTKSQWKSSFPVGCVMRVFESSKSESHTMVYLNSIWIHKKKHFQFRKNWGTSGTELRNPIPKAIHIDIGAHFWRGWTKGTRGTKDVYSYTYG